MCPFEHQSFVDLADCGTEDSLVQSVVVLGESYVLWEEDPRRRELSCSASSSAADDAEKTE